MSDIGRFSLTEQLFLEGSPKGPEDVRARFDHRGEKRALLIKLRKKGEVASSTGPKGTVRERREKPELERWSS